MVGLADAAWATLGVSDDDVILEELGTRTANDNGTRGAAQPPPWRKAA